MEDLNLEINLVGIFLITLIICFVLLVKKMMKISKKDWETVYDFEKRAETLKTKKEIKAFYNEFVEKTNKIHNHLITPKITYIDGYIRGKYEQCKN